jgi:hypothetical protein
MEQAMATFPASLTALAASAVPRLPRRWLAAAWASALLGSACAAPPPAAPAAPAAKPAGSSAELMAQVRAEIGAANCTSTAQCRAVAVGAKACGGPEAYLAWSITTSREDRLMAAAAAQAEARRRENEQSGRMSDCMMLAEPAARCVAGRCVLDAASPGGGATAR